MKKLCLLLALLLALSGCGESNPSESTDVPDNAIQTADVPESPAPETSEVDDGETENAFPAFTTTDLEGNTVTQDVFLGKDLTVVNVWGTYCGPCINEMPELGEWAARMPDNVQLLGIVCDWMAGDEGETLELARDIVARTGANYTSVAMCEGLAWLDYNLEGVPTTFFVNGNGEMVGEVILGAYVDQYKTQVETLLYGNPR